MPQLLTLSRAARLVGVTRSTLQQKIHRGELTTFEGQVTVTDLLRAYPETKMEDTTMLDRIEQIKAEAGYDQYRSDQATLPSPEILATRLLKLSKELILVQSELKRHTELIEALLQKLSELTKTQEAPLRVHFLALYDWLVAERQRNAPSITASETQLLARDTVLRIMAAHVKLIPSGHEFFVEGNNSILESALQAGLALNYGCSNGNCGLCKARIVSGEVHKIRHHDYVIGEAEKSMGYKLLCAYTAITDLVVEAAEAHRVEDIPQQHIEAKVKHLTQVTDNLLVLHLQTPRTKTLRFFAGQMVTLGLEDRWSADYFIASCPCDGRNLEFHLSKILTNPFTEYVFNNLRIGQPVNIDGPQGDFILQENSTRPTLFMAYAHGFAPIKSLIEHAMALDNAESFHLYWLAPHENELYQNNLCRAWTDALDHFQYTPVIVNVNDETLLTQNVWRIVENHADLNRFEIYITGPTPFINLLKPILQQQQIPEAQFHLGYV